VPVSYLEKDSFLRVFLYLPCENNIQLKLGIVPGGKEDGALGTHPTCYHVSPAKRCGSIKPVRILTLLSM
jgi:hypothetical protein